MQAIILNSGKGSRLEELTTDTPKGLITLDNKTTLLSRQLNSLFTCKVDNIIITTGYLEDHYKEYLKKRYPEASIRLVFNEAYATTNYIVSLDKLSHISFDQDIILMHGDLVFSLDVIQDLIAQKESSVVIDTLAPIPEKDFKARVGQNNLVQEIGVNVFGNGSYACQPLYKLKCQDWVAWQKVIRTFCESGETAVYAEVALNSILNNLALHPYDVKGRLCMEVDNKKDLQRARKLFKSNFTK